MSPSDEFVGFMVNDHKKWSSFKKQNFKTKNFEDNDVDIKIECCGVCGSDVHTITGGWGEASLPICVGHEVIGTAVKVGKNCKTGVKVGDRVGVGAQVLSCLKCELCKSNNENYCPHQINTYGSPYETEASGKVVSQGGFASHIRVHEYFVFPIPSNIPSEEAGPMMCAGLTTYSPLVRAGIGPGKKVAIVGIGGLGHFALLWAKALGAEVWALSHTKDKESDATKLGADHFVFTGDKDWSKPLAFKFDFILNSADMTSEMPVPEYLSTLNVNGDFHNVGIPDKPLPELKAFDFVGNGCKISGSHIGSRVECLQMLKLASEKGIHPWIQKIQVGEEGCKEAVEKVYNNEVRYRCTLVGYEKVFG